MAVLPIPLAILHRIEKLILNFLWDSGSSKRHHWIGNDRIFRPKRAGGLGLRSMKDIMLALHGKMAWRFIQKESLWARFAHSRFKMGKAGSPVWNTIDHLISAISIDSGWLIGQGSILVDRICSHYNIRTPNDCAGLCVRTVLRTPHLRMHWLLALPSSAMVLYDNVVFGNEKDRLFWRSSSSGEFTTKGFLHSFRTHHGELEWAKTIWQSWLPPKTSLFMWRFFLNGLPIDSNLRTVGVHIASVCPLCMKEEENLNHLFFLCPKSIGIWRFLSQIFDCSRPLSRNGLIRSWLSGFKKKDFMHCLRIGLCFSGLWEIWKARNRLIFDGQQSDLHQSLLQWARNLSPLIHHPLDSSLSNDHALALLNIPNPNKIQVHGNWMVWDPGALGACLNIAIKLAGQSMKGAGIVRSMHGDFLLAFSNHFPRTDDWDELIRFMGDALTFAKSKGIMVGTVQSSHARMAYFDNQNVGARPWQSIYRIRRINQEHQVRKFHRICSLVNHASICLLHTCSTDLKTDNFCDLPLAVQRSIRADKNTHYSYCPSLNCDHVEAVRPFPSSISEFPPNPCRNRSWIDDTSISYR